MAAHQRHVVDAKAFREIAPLFDIGDEQVGVAEIVGDVPDRHLSPDKAARMDHRPQLRRISDAEGQRVLGMRVYDRHDIGPRLEDRGVNEPLEIKRAFFLAHWPPVETELDDVIGGDELRSYRAGDQKMVRVVRVTQADMAVGVDHVLLCEDAIGNHQIPEGVVEAAHVTPLSTAAATRRHS